VRRDEPAANPIRLRYTKQQQSLNLAFSWLFPFIKIVSNQFFSNETRNTHSDGLFLP
jgi:hypothetical protein